jgi:hypothetical protein
VVCDGGDYSGTGGAGSATLSPALVVLRLAGEREREFWPAEELLLANLKFLFTGHAASLL